MSLSGQALEHREAARFKQVLLLRLQRGVGVFRIDAELECVVRCLRQSAPLRSATVSLCPAAAQEHHPQAFEADTL